MSQGPDYVVIGHVTHDLLSEAADAPVVPGGTALYAAITAARLGRRVGVATSGRLPATLASLESGTVIRCQFDERATTFVNLYHAGRRTQYIREVAPPIAVDRLPANWRCAPIIHLGPVAQEIAADSIQFLQPTWLCATPQGWLRRWNDAGLVSLGPPATDPLAHLPLAVLVLSEGAEEEQAGALMAEVEARGGLVVITRGARGSTLRQANECLEIPTYPVDEIDPTGAGDVYAAALFIRLAAGDPPAAAAAYASAAGALSVTGRGTSAIPDDAAIRRLIAR